MFVQCLVERYNVLILLIVEFDKDLTYKFFFLLPNILFETFKRYKAEGFMGYFRKLSQQK